MKQNEFRTELIIHTENDHPNIVTDALKIKPTKTYVKGEQWYTPFDKRPIPGKVMNAIFGYTLRKKSMSTKMNLFI